MIKLPGQNDLQFADLYCYWKYDKATLLAIFPNWGFMGGTSKIIHWFIYCQVNYMSYSIPDDMVACGLVKKSWSSMKIILHTESELL